MEPRAARGSRSSPRHHHARRPRALQRMDPGAVPELSAGLPVHPALRVGRVSFRSTRSGHRDSVPHVDRAQGHAGRRRTLHRTLAERLASPSAGVPGHYGHFHPRPRGDRVREPSRPRGYGAHRDDRQVRERRDRRENSRRHDHVLESCRREVVRLHRRGSGGTEHHVHHPGRTPARREDGPLKDRPRRGGGSIRHRAHAQGRNQRRHLADRIPGAVFRRHHHRRLEDRPGYRRSHPPRSPSGSRHTWSAASSSS